MKICMLGPRYFPARIGGAENQVYEMTMRLAKAGHEVHVFAAETGEEVHKNVRTVKVPAMKLELADFSFTYATYTFFSFFWALWHTVRQKYDIIHANSHPAGIVGVLIKLLTGTKLVYTMQGTGPENIEARGGVIGGLVSFMDGLTLKHSDYVISTTEHILETVRKFHKTELKNAEVIPNGIDVGRFSTGRPDVVRRQLGLDGMKTVIYVGRLSEVKGVKYLVEGFARAVKFVPDSVLLLVGDGQLKASLKEHARMLGVADKVIFTGTRRDIPDLLSASDVLALTSLHEGMPNVVLEAMAAGKPVVASRITSMGQIVVEGKTGLLVETRDTGSIAKALTKLLKDKRLAAKMGKAASKEVQKYSYDRLIKRIISVYERVLGIGTASKNPPSREALLKPRRRTSRSASSVRKRASSSRI